MRYITSIVQSSTIIENDQVISIQLIYSRHKNNVKNKLIIHKK